MMDHNSWTTRLQHLFATAAVAVLLGATSPAIANAQCISGDAPVDVMTAEWAKTCGHRLCGIVYATQQANVDDWGSCRHDTWRPLLEAMDNTYRSNGLVLLGEVHDNGEHHRLRAILLENNDSAVFEQIRADQQGGLDSFAEQTASSARLVTTADLLKHIDWDKSAWSKTADYRPLFEAVVRARLPVYAGDPPRDLMRGTAREGSQALPNGERQRLGLHVALGQAQDEASLAEIDASHCGMIPKSAQPNMALAQRYRDAFMADVLLKAADAHGSAILFAGNGHVRSDRGVPWYVRLRAPSRAVMSVVLVEVEDGKTDPADYVPRDPDGKPAADFVVFTPRGVRDGDPCDKMKPPAAGPAPPR
jgi:uncharacterized iron-regulated protein